MTAATDVARVVIGKHIWMTGWILSQGNGIAITPLGVWHLN